VLPERIARAARAIEAALRVGVYAAMNEFNRDPDAGRRRATAVRAAAAAASSTLLQEFSIPLLVGIAAAMLAANLAPDAYHASCTGARSATLALFGHALDLHYLVNDCSWCSSSGSPRRRSPSSCPAGGDLNPPAKAVNPLIATLGGVSARSRCSSPGSRCCSQRASTSAATDDWAALARGWGVPTATDIALAWLVARAVFGRGHPAINFLLLIAVVDDGIGLAIIALFYGDPAHPAQPAFSRWCCWECWLAFACAGSASKSWLPYVALGGPLAWLGLALARLHPALALAFIVPFLPARAAATDVAALRCTIRAPAQALRRLRPVLVRVHAGRRDARGRRAAHLARARIARPRQDRGHRAVGALAIRLGFPLPARDGRARARDGRLRGRARAHRGAVRGLGGVQRPALLGQARWGRSCRAWSAWRRSLSVDCPS
jgi:hypothetical protein